MYQWSSVSNPKETLYSPYEDKNYKASGIKSRQSSLLSLGLNSFADYTFWFVSWMVPKILQIPSQNLRLSDLLKRSRYMIVSDRFWNRKYKKNCHLIVEQLHLHLKTYTIFAALNFSKRLCKSKRVGHCFYIILICVIISIIKGVLRRIGNISAM